MRTNYGMRTVFINSVVVVLWKLEISQVIQSPVSHWTSKGFAGPEINIVNYGEKFFSSIIFGTINRGREREREMVLKRTEIDTNKNLNTKKNER